MTYRLDPLSADEVTPVAAILQRERGVGDPEPKANRNIEKTDVVLWYMFGMHHVTRPEDWPVMPVDMVSFGLKPRGFFDRNPALDVVGTPPDACHTDSTSAGH